eukprot:226863_1
MERSSVGSGQGTSRKSAEIPRERKKRKKRKQKQKRRKKYDSEDDYDFESEPEDDILWGDTDDEEDGGMKNVFVLTGSTGSGKTAMVHAAARSSQCDLIEINTTMERGGKSIKKIMEESTQSLSDFSKMRMKRGRSTNGLGYAMLDESGGNGNGRGNILHCLSF